jgi:hypothetical protein
MVILGSVMILSGLSEPVDTELYTDWEKLEELKSELNDLEALIEELEGQPYPYIEDIHESVKNLQLEV